MRQIGHGTEGKKSMHRKLWNEWLQAGYSDYLPFELSQI